MSYIIIKYDCGSMTVSLDEFLPTTKSNLNHLLNIINEKVWELDERLKLLDTIATHLIDEISQTEKEMIAYKKAYWEYRQEFYDTSYMIENKKRANGVPLKREELAKIKSQNKTAKTEMNRSLTNFKRMNSKRQKCLQNLNVVNDSKNSNAVNASIEKLNQSLDLEKYLQNLNSINAAIEKLNQALVKFN